jgi:hypothetical protein
LSLTLQLCMLLLLLWLPLLLVLVLRLLMHGTPLVTVEWLCRIAPSWLLLLLPLARLGPTRLLVLLPLALLVLLRPGLPPVLPCLLQAVWCRRQAPRALMPDLSRAAATSAATNIAAAPAAALAGAARNDASHCRHHARFLGFWVFVCGCQAGPLKTLEGALCDLWVLFNLH